MAEIDANVNAANTILTPAADPYPKYKTEVFNLFGGINAKVSNYMNGSAPQQFRDLQNLNFFFPGALNKRPGSTLYGGGTIAGPFLGGIEFQRLAGQSWIVAAANTNLYNVSQASGYVPMVTGLSGGLFQFQTMVDRLFCANGNQYFKYDGTNNYLYSLPPGPTLAWGITSVVGGSLLPGVTGTFVYGYGYVNERGYAGPVTPGQTIVLDGITSNSVLVYGLTQAYSGYGITALAIWRTSPGGVNLFNLAINSIGSLTAIDNGSIPLGTSLALPHLWFTMAPRFVCIYNNQLFMAGFSQFPSRFYWSEIGEPEGVQPTYYAEVLTNNGDVITGLKPYGGALVISKSKSLHRLIGDNPANFALQDVTTEYGSLSQQSMVIFENLLWFMDPKGMVQYDGSNIDVVSTPVEPYFIGANPAININTAVAAHYKQIGEVWFNFSFDGSTTNSLLLAYDYTVQAWTRYDNINAAAMFIGQGDQTTKTIFYGGYTGGLFYLGQSYMSDNGVAFTCAMFTNWLAASGQTTENMYRRLWMDVDPIIGITQVLSFHLYSNYSTLAFAYTGAVAITAFQNRTDFGVSARALALQVSYSSATLPFKINAYTFESRYQRSV